MKNKEETAQSVSNAVLDKAAQLHKIYEPQWNSRADVLKVIVSLSSASIVLSVTFSSSLRSLKVTPLWSYVIVFIFALLVVSHILAFVALRMGTRLYEVQSNFLDRRMEIQKAVMDATSMEDVLKTFSGIIDNAFAPIQRSDKR